MSCEFLVTLGSWPVVFEMIKGKCALFEGVKRMRSNLKNFGPRIIFTPCERGCIPPLGWYLYEEMFYFLLFEEFRA